MSAATIHTAQTPPLVLATACVAVATLAGACARPSADSFSPAASGRTRVYYIAAEEVDWDFAPSGMDKVHGEKYHFQDDPNSKGTIDPNNTTYRKALFREYTDASFRTPKQRADAWAHLGVLRPLIRAEVGDTITVVFRNGASRSYSMHPHGVFYAKDSEGARYNDRSTDADEKDDAVPPGGMHTYRWLVPERAGPTASEGSTAFWLYHSHVDEGRDINSGLVGPLIVTRRGMARPDGSPTDVDRELVAQFALFDEHLSWYWDFNVKRIYGDTRNYDGANEGIHDFHHFWTINGFMDGNGPLLTMRRGERVRWYLFANPNEQEALDIHTAHWHGETATVGHGRTDMIMLTPMMTVVADMVPDNVGTWMFHCHMPGHFLAGMRTLFQVLH